MKRLVYIFVFLVIVYEIFVGIFLIFKRENILLSEYWGWGLLVIVMVVILGLLNGIFGGEKFLNILVINIFVVIIINLIFVMFIFLILIEDVK